MDQKLVRYFKNHPDLWGEVLNLYAVYTGLRPGFWCESYTDQGRIDPKLKTIIKRLGLVRNSQIPSLPSSDALITKVPIETKKPLSDMDIGIILGYFCIDEEWDNYRLERIAVEVYLQGKEGYEIEMDQLVVFMCVSKNIKASNVKELIAYTETLKKGFMAIVKELGIQKWMGVKVTYTATISNEAQKARVILSKKGLLDWKIKGVKPVDKRTRYTFKT